MTDDKREPIPEAERVIHGLTLQALGKEFERNADSLADSLVTIVQWLRLGATDPRPDAAFDDCNDRMTHTYFLLGEIGRITGRASRT
jgi:hypothetical protein